MKIFVCLDEKNGMTFNKRRQSSDRVVRANMLQMVADGILYTNTYTAKQFVEENTVLVVDDNCLELAKEQDYVFIENIEISEYLPKIEQIIVYRWKRNYPADCFFDVDLLSEEWELSLSEEFEGYSHECIGKEIYTKKYLNLTESRKSPTSSA